jgi:hypothetical protein
VAEPPTSESWREYVAVCPAFTVAEVEPPAATRMEKAAFMVSVSAADALAANPPEGEGITAAVIECSPDVSELVGKAAWPVLSRVTFPRNVLPSKKEAEPDGIPLVELKTAAVNVTCCPTIDGFKSDVSVVIVETPSSPNS